MPSQAAPEPPRAIKMGRDTMISIAEGMDLSTVVIEQPTPEGEYLLAIFHEDHKEVRLIAAVPKPGSGVMTKFELNPSWAAPAEPNPMWTQHRLDNLHTEFRSRTRERVPSMPGAMTIFKELLQATTARYQALLPYMNLVPEHKDKNGMEAHAALLEGLAEYKMVAYACESMEPEHPEYYYVNIIDGRPVHCCTETYIAAARHPEVCMMLKLSPTNGRTLTGITQSSHTHGLEEMGLHVKKRWTQRSIHRVALMFDAVSHHMADTGEDILPLTLALTFQKVLHAEGAKLRSV